MADHPDAARFMQFVHVEPNSGCWLWRGALDMRGRYGRFWMDGRSIAAHRASHKIFKGTIHEAHEPDHTCRTTWCVNPDHLEAVTRRVNVLRGESPAAHHARKTHCVKGHALEGENLRIAHRRGRSARVCRACSIAASKAWRQKEAS